MRSSLGTAACAVGAPAAPSRNTWPAPRGSTSATAQPDSYIHATTIERLDRYKIQKTTQRDILFAAFLTANGETSHRCAVDMVKKAVHIMSPLSSFVERGKTGLMLASLGNACYRLSHLNLALNCI